LSIFVDFFTFSLYFFRISFKMARFLVLIPLILCFAAMFAAGAPSGAPHAARVLGAAPAAAEADGAAVVRSVRAPLLDLSVGSDRSGLLGDGLVNLNLGDNLGLNNRRMFFARANSNPFVSQFRIN
jgi:hypothetical protein